MALSLRTKLENKEFRGVVDDTFLNDEGKKVPFMKLVLEDDDEKVSQIRISVPEELRPEIRGCGLIKGCLVDVTVDVKAGNNYNSLRLVSLDDVRDGDTMAAGKLGY